MDSKGFYGITRQLVHPTADTDRAVVGLLAHAKGATPVRVTVIARGIVRLAAGEDVAKNERATALPDGSVGGRGDVDIGTIYPDRARLDAWWGRPVRAGEVGYLKVGEPWTDDELARCP